MGLGVAEALLPRVDDVRRREALHLGADAPPHDDRRQLAARAVLDRRAVVLVAAERVEPRPRAELHELAAAAVDKGVDGAVGDGGAEAEEGEQHERHQRRLELEGAQPRGALAVGGEQPDERHRHRRDAEHDRQHERRLHRRVDLDREAQVVHLEVAVAQPDGADEGERHPDEDEERRQVAHQAVHDLVGRHDPRRRVLDRHEQRAQQQRHERRPEPQRVQRRLAAGDAALGAERPAQVAVTVGRRLREAAQPHVRERHDQVHHRQHEEADAEQPDAPEVELDQRLRHRLLAVVVRLEVGAQPPRAADADGAADDQHAAHDRRARQLGEGGARERRAEAREHEHAHAQRQQHQVGHVEEPPPRPRLQLPEDLGARPAVVVEREEVVVAREDAARAQLRVLARDERGGDRRARVAVTLHAQPDRLGVLARLALALDSRQLRRRRLAVDQVLEHRLELLGRARRARVTAERPHPDRAARLLHADRNVLGLLLGLPLRAH